MGMQCMRRETAGSWPFLVGSANVKGRYGQEGVGAYHVLSCPNPFKTKASHLTPCQISSERQTASGLVCRVQGLQRVIYTHCGPMLPGNIISLYTRNQPRATMGWQVCENLSLGSVGDPLYVCCTKTKTTTCYKLDLFLAILNLRQSPEGVKSLWPAGIFW